MTLARGRDSGTQCQFGDEAAASGTLRFGGFIELGVRTNAELTTCAD